MPIFDQQLQLKDARPRFLAMNPPNPEHLDRADARVTRERDATARQAAYIEALARDGHDAATARKLLRAFEEMEALHTVGGPRRPWGPPS